MIMFFSVKELILTTLYILFLYLKEFEGKAYLNRTLY